MKAVLTILVVAMLLCIVLSSEASDVLQCTGVKLTDGQYYFNILYEDMEDNCETQWLVDEKVAGISDAEGKQFAFPIVNLSVTGATLQTCPETLECLLICPRANIRDKLQCSCDASPLTTLPEGDVSPTALPEVGFSSWRVYILIGVVVVVVVVLVIALIIVLFWKRQGSGYVLGDQGAAERIV